MHFFLVSYLFFVEIRFDIVQSIGILRGKLTKIDFIYSVFDHSNMVVDQKSRFSYLALGSYLKYTY